MTLNKYVDGNAVDGEALDLPRYLWLPSSLIIIDLLSVLLWLTLPLHRLRLHPIKHCNHCFFRIFPAFSGLFMDTIERTYNIDPSLAIHRKKSPIGSMCRL